MPAKKMKAAVIHEFGGIEKISIEEVPVTFPKDNEVQIAIEYAGVNPVDWKICEGIFRGRMGHEFPLILGWDAAGKVIAKGKNVKKFKEGDEVFAYCRKESLHDGSYAEYICLDAKNVAFKPRSLTFAQAASVPLASLTAWQSLFDTIHLQPKENVLIHAGAGGVGSFAIQLAKIAGAKVITTTSASHHDYVKKIGADLIIDYTKDNFVDRIQTQFPQGIDAVFDTVGGETLKASYRTIKEGGRLVTIAGIVDQALAADTHVHADYVLVSANGEELQKISDFLEQGTMQPPKIQEIHFNEIPLALRQNREGHTEGKIVIKIH